eukprot:1124338-Pelagomonas_calceolata.AAC.11
MQFDLRNVKNSYTALSSPSKLGMDINEARLYVSFQFIDCLGAPPLGCCGSFKLSVVTAGPSPLHFRGLGVVGSPEPSHVHLMHSLGPALKRSSIETENLEHRKGFRTQDITGGGQNGIETQAYGCG